MQHEDILHRCFRCGWCKFTSDYAAFNCPSYRKYRFDTFAPGGRLWLIRAWLTGKIQNSGRFQEILYSCATCGNCVEHCAFTFREDLITVFIEAREELVNSGRIPPIVRDTFKAIQVHGNPYGQPSRERGAWASQLDVEPFRGQDYLLYIGCVGSYDERGKAMARSLATLLKRTGVSFGILGEREICDGNEVRVLGEAGLFQFLAESNIALFKEVGAKRIVTLDPHAYNAFLREYPRWGGDFDVLHYTQLLARLLEMGKLPLGRVSSRVTYHDPCYLGRHNGEYAAPRRLLEAVPGLRLTEMRQARENAFCCGGGGGNFFTDILGGGEDSPNRVRVRQALETGADILAVACPQCAKMLEDGLKAEAQERRIEVLDLAEILSRALP